MRLLLDTHIVIWAMVGSSKLSNEAREILEDIENELYVSSVSIWEVAIKHAARPQEIPVTPEQMIRFCRESGIIELPIRFEHSQKVCALPKYHNDPFDRMLVSQSVAEGMYLVTHDHKLPPYGKMILPI